jgi:hypothetical protein
MSQFPPDATKSLYAKKLPPEVDSDDHPPCAPAPRTTARGYHHPPHPPYRAHGHLVASFLDVL